MDKQDLVVKLLETTREENNIGHANITKRLDTLNGQVAKNSEFRVSTKAMVALIKFGIPIVGLTGLVNLIDFVISLR